ncbi:GNAT family N-acetyltransferase [Thioclava sediminum]|uniref:GNAT family N-acetyltransferase n=1 Tax=Thioclava sediminum TaxID=1915319 RepID=A0ABX3N2A6_9RHOB|nr:GNAT family N-acetyltransferase [Thioclava sediminum]OOY26096.1 GNAT family N-acetyltransferase [Thioclava sediminum]
MRTRNATPADAAALADVLEELVSSGQRSKASDAEFVRSHYLEHPDLIRCAICEDEDGQALGLQSLKHARAGNPYGTPEGWGIIGTHVRPSAARRGVGRRLWAWSLSAARGAGLVKIEAYIGAENAAALAYYGQAGFETWRETDGAIGKVYTLD